MTVNLTHHCPVPGCDTTMTEEVHTLPAGQITGEQLAEFMAMVSASRAEAADRMRAHVSEHWMPGEVVDGAREVVTINALTDADGQPGWGLGPDVALLVLVTGEGMAQIIGRPDLDGHAASHALQIAAQEVHKQATGAPFIVMPCGVQEDV